MARGTQKRHGLKHRDKNSDEVLNQVWVPGGVHDNSTYWDWITFKNHLGSDTSPFMVMGR